MTTEQAAAVERLRRHKSGLVTYWSSPDYVEDAQSIIDLYLAEHPADSDEPVTEEWLRSVLPWICGVWPNGFKYLEHGAQSKTLTVSLPVDGMEEWSVGGERIPHELMPATRGDVRRLCRALGIELKPA